MAQVTERLTAVTALGVKDALTLSLGTEGLRSILETLSELDARTARSIISEIELRTACNDLSELDLRTAVMVTDE